jgi:hypothetical protein
LIFVSVVLRATSAWRMWLSWTRAGLTQTRPPAKAGAKIDDGAGE